MLGRQSAGIYFSCATKSDGTAWCWGNKRANAAGAEPESSYVPEQVDDVTDWATISVFGYHICGVKTGGSLWCFGLNSNGQLGDGTTVNENSPVRIGADRDWAMVSAGGHHTCATKTDGSAWCWGWNGYGQVGDGTQGVDRLTPRPVVDM